MIDLSTWPWTEIVSTLFVVGAIVVKHLLDIIRERKSLDREWAVERRKKAYDKKLETLEEIRDQLPALKSAVFGPFSEIGAMHREERRVCYDKAMKDGMAFENLLLKMKPYLSSDMQTTSSKLVQVVFQGRVMCQAAGSLPGTKREGRGEEFKEGFELLTKDARLIIDQLDEECIVEIGKMIETGH